MPAKNNSGLPPKKLYYKFLIDTWGHFFLKRKYRYRVFLRMVTNFEYHLRKTMIKLLRPFPKKSFHTKNWEKFRQQRQERYSKKEAAFNRAFPQRPRPASAPAKPQPGQPHKFQYTKKPPKALVALSAPRTSIKKPRRKKVEALFFKSLFKYYFKYQNYAARNNTLATFWRRALLMRLRNKIPTFLFYVRKKRRRAFLRRPYIKRKSITVQRKLTLLRYQQYFCLPSITRTKNFLRRYEFNYYKLTKDVAFMGIEGNILNLIYRTNLFPTTRFAYTLIKLGAVYVNDVQITGPNRSLQVMDTFTINPSFIKSIFRYFRRRVKRRLLLVNAPNYLSFNYRIMRFKVWRRPTERERRFFNSFPFRRPVLDLHLAPAGHDVFLDPSVE